MLAIGLIVFVSLAGLLPKLSQAALDTPQILSYQGRLTDAQKVTVPDGARAMAFIIYDAATLGNCEWTAAGTCGTPTTVSITVTDGLFNVMLGASPQIAFPDPLFNTTEERWLEIRIDGETLTPRRRIVSSATALQAGNASLLDSFDTSQTGGTAAFVPVTTATGALTLSVGSATTPTYSFSGDTNTGLYAAGADTLAMATSGSEAMRIEGDNNIAIGATSATSWRTRIIGSTATSGFAILRLADVAAGTEWGFGINGGCVPSGTMTIGYKGTGNTPCGGDHHNVLSLTSGDFVGIGTTSPSFKLDVETGASDTAVIAARDSVGGVWTEIGRRTITQRGGGFFINAQEGDMTLQTAGTDRLTVLNTNGNVGIGTTSPGSILDIVGALSVREMSAPALSPADQGRIYFDATSNKFRVSEHGGAYTDLVQAGGASGWTDDGAVVRLTTITDSVGIGDATPSFPLELNAPLTANATFAHNSNTLATFKNTTAVANSWGVLKLMSDQGTGLWFSNETDDGTHGYIKTEFTGNMYFGTGSDGGAASDRMVIDPTGQIGVGDMTPDAQLDVEIGFKSVRINDNLGGLTEGGVISFTRPDDGGVSATIGVTEAGNDDFGIYSGSGVSQIRIGSNTGGGTAVGVALFGNPSQTNIFGNTRPTPDVALLGNGTLVAQGNTSGSEQMQILNGNKRVLINNSIGSVTEGGSIAFSRPDDGGTSLLIGVSEAGSDDGVIYSASGGSQVRIAGSAGAGTVTGIGFYPNIASSVTVFGNARPAAPVEILGNGDFIVGNSATGRIGIGTNTPSLPLDVRGTFGQMIIGNATAGQAGSIAFRRGDGTSCGAVGFDSPTSDDMRVYACNGGVYLNAANSSATNIISLLTNNTERMRVDVDGNVGIGVTGPADKLEVVAGTLATGRQAFSTSSTLSSTAAFQLGNDFQVTGAGSAAFAQYALRAQMNPGYTGSKDSIAVYGQNDSLATGAFSPIVNDTSIGANHGLYGFVSGAGAGTKIGVRGVVRDGTGINVGMFGTTDTPGAGSTSYGVVGNTVFSGGATNIGVAGFSLNGGTNTIGGYFGLQATTPTFTSAALIADNGVVAAPIFIARDNGTEMFRIADGGNVGIGDSTPENVLDIEAGTLAAGVNAFSVNATLPTTPTGNRSGFVFNIVGAGSGADSEYGGQVNFNAGYTGAASTYALAVGNENAGTGSADGFAGDPSAAANFSLWGETFGSTTGTNIGAMFTGALGATSIGFLGNTGNSALANNGYRADSLNYAVLGAATLAKNASSTTERHIGIAGTALNGDTNIGGYFGLRSAAPNFTTIGSGALIADNGVTTSPIFVANDNATTVFTIIDGGNVGIGTTTPYARLEVSGNVRSIGKATAVLTGDIDPTTSTTVTGVGTLFLTELTVGDRIVVSGETRSVVAIATDTSLTVDLGFTNNPNDTDPDVLYALHTMKTSAGVTQFVVNDLGNVGIGSGSPDMLLETESSSAISDGINIINSSTGDPILKFSISGGGATFTAGIDNSDLDKFKIGTTSLDTSTRLTINASGNVGIGDDSPSARLEVGDGTDSLQVSSVGDLTFVDANGAASITGPAGGALTIASGTDNNIVLSPAGTGDLVMNIANANGDALDIQEGTNNYIHVDTNAENISFGNATTNPQIHIEGTGGFSFMSGTVNINDGVGNQILTGTSAGASINLGAQQSQRLCHSGTDGATGLRALGDCDGAQADYAEMYPVVAGAVAGDIVMLGATDVTTTQGDVIKQLVKTTAPYEAGLVGVVSDPASGDVNIIGFNINPADNPQPVALVGRVNVKVNDENGAIAVGDAITSSSTAGIGMKATKPGFIVGRALNAWAGPGQGTIMVFVNTEYYVGATLTLNGSVTTFEDSLVVEDTLTLNGSLVLNSGVADNAFVTKLSKLSVTGGVALDGNCSSGAAEGWIFQNDAGTQVGHACIDATDKMHWYAESFNSTGTDIAESYNAKAGEVIEKGDVVALDILSGEQFTVTKADTVNANIVLGIIATRPGIKLSGVSEDGKRQDNARPVFVALAGRVPTNVNTQNGPIAIGDLLTISSTPGVAMKRTDSGPVIGRALRPLASGTGKIEVFVHLEYLPQNTASQVAQQQAQNFQIYGDVDFAGYSITNIKSIRGMKWSIDEHGALAVKSAKTGQLIITKTDEKATLDSGIFPMGSDTMFVLNPAAHAYSEIFLSWQGNPGSVSWVQDKHEGGFTVKLAAPAATGVMFSYWIVDVEDTRASVPTTAVPTEPVVAPSAESTQPTETATTTELTEPATTTEWTEPAEIIVEEPAAVVTPAPAPAPEPVPEPIPEPAPEPTPELVSEPTPVE